jgi:serine/threonine protein phosphatase 1
MTHFRFVNKFGLNQSGRDFVVGDIHGEFVLLNQELARVGFRPSCDRLFSVGDLIDRGPDSLAALEWLAKPWFHAILGNHEEMALQSEHNPEILRNWVDHNGGDWWLDLDETQQRRCREVFACLPLAIEVETADGPVGIVHANVPSSMSWQEFLARLEAGDKFVRDKALWSRERFRGWGRGDRGEVEGIRRIYCGHTPIEEPRLIGNILMIDTGACYGGNLTLLPLGDL